MLTKKNIIKTLYLSYFLVLYSCLGDGKHIHCAEVDIENVENPGTYILSVELYQGSVYKIYFPKGGNLDQSHFDKNDAKLKYDEFGEYASFEDDRGRIITVRFSEDGNQPCYQDRGILLND